MKKAKVILSAIAIAALIGGVFAFKASRTPASGLARITVTFTTTVGGAQLTTAVTDYCTLAFTAAPGSPSTISSVYPNTIAGTVTTANVTITYPRCNGVSFLSTYSLTTNEL